VAGVEPRHHARQQGQPLDRRQRRERRPHPEVHARRQVRQAVFSLFFFYVAYASAGSNDMWAFSKVAKISLDEGANEAYVSDGYGNKRVAVIDMDTGKIKRYWARTATSRTTPISATTTRRAARAAVPQPCALRGALEGRSQSTCAIVRTIASRCSARMGNS